MRHLLREERTPPRHRAQRGQPPRQIPTPGPLGSNNARSASRWSDSPPSGRSARSPSRTVAAPMPTRPPAGAARPGCRTPAARPPARPRSRNARVRRHPNRRRTAATATAAAHPRRRPQGRRPVRVQPQRLDQPHSGRACATDPRRPVPPPAGQRERARSSRARPDRVGRGVGQRVAADRSRQPAAEVELAVRERHAGVARQRRPPPCALFGDERLELVVGGADAVDVQDEVGESSNTRARNTYAPPGALALATRRADTLRRGRRRAPGTCRARAAPAGPSSWPRIGARSAMKSAVSGR
jgi:hypothetical protein